MCHGKVEERKTERTVDQAFDQQCSKDWQLPKTVLQQEPELLGGGGKSLLID